MKKTMLLLLCADLLLSELGARSGGGVVRFVQSSTKCVLHCKAAWTQTSR